MWLIVSITMLGAVAWFWMDSMNARDAANFAGSRACRKSGLQFLDGTAAFSQLNIIRQGNGIGIRRVFIFDYSEDGEDRKQGFVIIVNRRVTGVGFEAQQTH